MVAYVVWDDVVAGSNPVTPSRLGNLNLYNASLVQLVERRSPKPDVVGSSPTEREFSNSFFSVSITKYNILVYISSLLFINKITIAYYVFLPILCKIIGFVVDKV